MFNFFKKNKGKKSEDKKPQLNFTDKLKLVKYFEFTDESDKSELVNAIQDAYTKSGTFSTTYKNDKSMCNKLFFCDAESLFEDDGYKSQITYMKNGIERVSDYNQMLKSIPPSFDYNSNPNSNWHDAVVDFTNRVNSELKNANSEYKFYPANGGNEGYLYILNEAQFHLLNKYIDDRQIRPHDMVNWNRIYNTTQEEYRKYIDRDEFKFKLGMSMTLKNHGKVKVTEVINDKSARIQIGYQVARIDVITGKYKLTFEDEQQKTKSANDGNFVNTDELKAGMKIKLHKFGKGQILEIDERRVVNIRFVDGDIHIVLKNAKIELDE